MSVAVGRRVALWRVRRQMTQQVLADRIGRSKSWVEKVERGVRRLDRFSLIRQVAEVLRVDPAELIGPARPSEHGGAVDGVAAVRAALASYEVFTAADSGPAVEREATQQVEHAWSTYQHGDYPRLLRMTPELLDAARRLHATRPGPGAELLVRAYRIIALVLVKVGEPELAWLAADRALAVAGGDPVLAGSAAVPLGQALRGLGQDRLAMTTTVAAADRIATASVECGPVYGTLLLQAGLAAAGCGETRSVDELLGRAADVAGRIGDGLDYRTASFGPAAVELAHVVAAVESGDARQAVRRHETATRQLTWRGLPAEHRAAYLVDAARAHLGVGDFAAAGRWLVEADRVAPAEIRCRPSARTVVAEIARCGPDTAGVARLATALGLTTGVS
ncbi:helix-turn-helix domain-containing protein [Solwaraspora sp. WMMA2080]|uniref:helix-turn-helix domain-containing protein n=1 Tax=unclassified Solwaraspora TaxID=2627926 RepID=UPI00248B8EB7|nr:MULTISPECIES: helix-turn-helix domain-containing protein [unclassified Solwaraspora]WBB98884.1 helix-turn-helix domain-containing protein [Solwaraspora sp. WMMA2059]WBC22563.1 helix-turn-helix domain-containing protein [Solwaraspora sp. WMMA2080]